MGLYFRFREKLRFSPTFNKAVYLSQSVYKSYFGRLVAEQRAARKKTRTAQGVAVCLRFRDEARYLAEWLEYHWAAGVDHFFLYNNFSSDDFLPVVQPWLDAGQATLVDWPKVPASPEAEEDCIRRAIGRFAWVGFLDADEFVVIRDARSIGKFLNGFVDAPAVGLHWRMFGSSGHRGRPQMPVIQAYQQRAPGPNRHIKTFLRPERAAECRNSHSWFYYPLGVAVREDGESLYGSVHMNPTADAAWINHYYCKSEEDYLEKAMRRSTLDRVGINFPTRRTEKIAEDMGKNNEVFDSCAVEYYRARCEALNRAPVLLEGVPMLNSEF